MPLPTDYTLNYSFASGRSGSLRSEQVLMENDDRVYTRIHITVLMDHKLEKVDLIRLSREIINIAEGKTS